MSEDLHYILNVLFQTHFVDFVANSQRADSTVWSYGFIAFVAYLSGHHCVAFTI